MSRFTLATRIALLVGSALVAGAASTGLLLWQLHATNASYDAMLSRNEVRHQDHARAIQVAFKVQVQEWKNLLIRGGAADQFTKYEQAFNAGDVSVRAQATSLLGQVTDPAARRLAEEFVTAHTAMRTSYQAAITTFRGSHGRDVAAADALVKGQDRAPTELLDRLAARLQQVVDELRVARFRAVQRSIVVLSGTLAVLFAAVIAGGVVTVRATQRELVELTGELHDGAHQVAAAANQVATSAQTLSQGATEQAASIEEVSASMEEMSSMTRLNAERSTSVAELMADAQARVQASSAALAELVGAMASIRTSTAEVAKIIKAIDAIAFQTNILALNAAVEAARAGEAGMGFAVVADEVRSLAQRVADAASRTSGLIEASMANVQGGGRKVDQVSAAITAFTDSVAQVKGLVDEVSEASRQQSQGIAQVSVALAQMEKVTQSTAATAEESAAASEELTAQAEQSTSTVAHFVRLVGGAGNAPAGIDRPRRGGATSPAAMPSRHDRGGEAEPPSEMPATGTYGQW